MAEEKIYMGSAIEKTFPDGGSIINVHLKLDGIAGLFEKYGYTSKNGEKRIKLNISTRRNIGTYGETHNITVDTWTPDGGGPSETPFEDQSTPITPPSGNKPREQSQPHQGGRDRSADGAAEVYTPPSGAVKDDYEDDIPF